MAQARFSLGRLVDAPADVVYRCLADYRAHHRPGGFLPPAFSQMHIERGGVGAGTVFRVNVTIAGRTNTLVQEVQEPEPGRVLVESGGGTTTTFSVEPDGQRCRVRFDTVFEVGGLQGLLMPLLLPRLLRPVYADELDRLERYAQALASSSLPQQATS